MFKNLIKGLLLLSVAAIMNNPAQAFYTDMEESHWAYQSIKFLTEFKVIVAPSCALTTPKSPEPSP